MEYIIKAIYLLIVLSLVCFLIYQRYKRVYVFIIKRRVDKAMRAKGYNRIPKEITNFIHRDLDPSDGFVDYDIDPFRGENLVGQYYYVNEKKLFGFW